MLSCAWMRVSVFVGHSRLQARLHLAAIKLHASRTPLHSSTAGSCFKASLHKTNWEHLTAWWLRLAGLTSANYLAIKCGCVRWNVSMVKMLTNRRDERKEDDRKQKREMESWSERWDEGCNVMTVAEKRLPGMKKKKRSENVSKLFCFSVSFLRFRTVHFRQTSHQNTFVNTTVVSMFCQGESHGSVTVALFFWRRVPRWQHDCHHGRDYWHAETSPWWSEPGCQKPIVPSIAQRHLAQRSVTL